jgi:hypothetical protein
MIKQYLNKLKAKTIKQIRDTQHIIYPYKDLSLFQLQFLFFSLITYLFGMYFTKMQKITR